jgi:hypothetical protein
MVSVVLLHTKEDALCLLTVVAERRLHMVAEVERLPTAVSVMLPHPAVVGTLPAAMADTLAIAEATTGVTSSNTDVIKNAALSGGVALFA